MEITSLIPHRPPMLLLDKLVEWDLDLKKLTASKTISQDDHFVQGHYPNYPIVPGVITCEMLFQSGACLMSMLLNEKKIGAKYDTPGVPVVSRIQQSKFKGMIRPGDTVQLTVELTDQVSSAFYLKGSAKVDGKTMATVDFTCMIAEFPV